MSSASTLSNETLKRVVGFLKQPDAAMSRETLNQQKITLLEQSSKLSEENQKKAVEIIERLFQKALAQMEQMPNALPTTPPLAKREVAELKIQLPVSQESPRVIVANPQGEPTPAALKTSNEEPLVVVEDAGSEEESESSNLKSSSNSSQSSESPRVVVSPQEQSVPAPVNSPVENGGQEGVSADQQQKSAQQQPADQQPVISSLADDTTNGSGIGSASGSQPAKQPPVLNSSNNTEDSLGLDQLVPEEPAENELSSDGPKESAQPQTSCAKTAGRVALRGLVGLSGAALVVGTFKGVPVLINAVRNSFACARPRDPRVYGCWVGELPFASLPEATDTLLNGLRVGSQLSFEFRNALEHGINAFTASPANAAIAAVQKAVDVASPWASSAGESLSQLWKSTPSLSLPSLERLRELTFPVDKGDEEGMQKSNIALVAATATVAILSVGLVCCCLRKKKPAQS